MNLKYFLFSAVFFLSSISSFAETRIPIVNNTDRDISFSVTDEIQHFLLPPDYRLITRALRGCVGEAYASTQILAQSSSYLRIELEAGKKWSYRACAKGGMAELGSHAYEAGREVYEGATGTCALDAIPIVGGLLAKGRLVYKAIKGARRVANAMPSWVHGFCLEEIERFVIDYTDESKEGIRLTVVLKTGEELRGENQEEAEEEGEEAENAGGSASK